MNRSAVLLPVVLCLSAANAPANCPDDTLVVVRDTVVDVSGSNLSDSLERFAEEMGEVEDSPLLDLLEDVIPRTSLESRSRVSRKLQPARGFTEGKYIGSAVKSYQRVRIRHAESVQAGVLFEKDAGEKRYDDFVAGYLQVKGVGPLQSLILGDYFIEAGQGIALWRVYDYQKGADVVTPVVRADRGLLPYLSSGETGFFRGIASVARFEPIALTTFLSKRNMTGTVDTAGNVTSLYTSGYFRTATEEEKRNGFTETILGFHAGLDAAFGTMGITGYGARYDRFLDLSGDGPGNRSNVLSADFAIMAGPARIFGEWGMTNGVAGGISGMHLSPGHDVDIVAAFRDYPKFSGLYGNGFGERQGMSGERGLYMGLAVKPVRGIRLSSYFDMFSFPTRTSGTLFTDKGHEILLAGDVSLVPRFLISPRYRRKVSVETVNGLDQYFRLISLDDRKTSQNFRLTLEYSVNARTRLRSRIEYTDLSFQYFDRREHGFLLYQDLLLRPSDRLLLNARITFFRTDSFESGIAEYERDLDGVLTIPVLYGHGVRWYLLAEYKISGIAQCSLKYSEAIRDDVRTVGSGLEELPANRDNRIALQCDLRM